MGRRGERRGDGTTPGAVARRVRERVTALVGGAVLASGVVSVVASGLATGLASGLATGLAGCEPEPQTPADVDPGLLGLVAPPLDADRLGGEGPTSLAGARGKVVIVDLFTTFSDPASASFPRYQQLIDQHPGEVAVFAVAIDDPRSAAREEILAFVRQHPADFPVLWDVTGTTTEAYDPPALPASYVIDREGVVRHVFGGYRADQVEGIAKAARELVK